MCGSAVNASASECPGCGEPFSPLVNEEPEFIEETVTEVTEEFEVPDENFDDTMVPDSGICGECEAPLSPDGTCHSCTPTEKEVAEGTDGCPICGN